MAAVCFPGRDGAAAMALRHGDGGVVATTALACPPGRDGAAAVALRDGAADRDGAVGLASRGVDSVGGAVRS